VMIESRRSGCPILRLLLAKCGVLFLLLAMPAFAADQPLTALSLAQRIDRHYNALRSLEVHFTQQYDGMGMHRKESGVLLMKKPGKMRWTYTNPDGKLFVLDGKDGYFYSPGSPEAQRVPAKKLDDLQSPLRFLLGHTELEKQLTNLQMTPNVDGGFVLSGVPKGLEKRIAAFSVTATAEGMIQSMKIEETDGVVNTFTFSGERPNAPAPDTSFVFHAPAGVNVVTGLPPV